VLSKSDRYSRKTSWREACREQPEHAALPKKNDSPASGCAGGGCSAGEAWCTTTPWPRLNEKPGLADDEGGGCVAARAWPSPPGFLVAAAGGAAGPSGWLGSAFGCSAADGPAGSAASEPRPPSPRAAGQPGTAAGGLAAWRCFLPVTLAQEKAWLGSGAGPPVGPRAAACCCSGAGAGTERAGSAADPDAATSAATGGRVAASGPGTRGSVVGRSATALSGLAASAGSAGLVAAAVAWVAVGPATAPGARAGGPAGWGALSSDAHEGRALGAAPGLGAGLRGAAGRGAAAAAAPCGAGASTACLALGAAEPSTCWSCLVCATTLRGS
jgi:hypothetical protein